MLLLINTNRMRPPIAPIGLDYIAGAARAAGIEIDVLDLCMADDPDAAIREYFARRSPRLVGLSFRNIDDSFYPSMQSFVPALQRIVGQLRSASGSPIVLGGCGYSIFPRRLLEATGADFGVHGDGEAAIVGLYRAVCDGAGFESVPGLLWRCDGASYANPPAWPAPLSVPTARDALDNGRYFRLGGQIGLETKRGCDRRCVFCADVLAKGSRVRTRSPAEVADEAEALLVQGIDVLHLCDAEFNIPYPHAMAVCEEFARRRLGERLRWYAYLAAVPFDDALAGTMRRAGCVGINFTGPAASDAMLQAYRQPHRQADIAVTVGACKRAGITAMLDLMLGGPGETPGTVAEAIGFARSLPLDAVGAGLGVRLHPDFELLTTIAAEAPLETHAGIRRRYDGPLDLLQPTFYVSPALGAHPAAVVRDCVGGDKRFFEPSDEVDLAAAVASRDHNYSDNDPLARAIAAGARGAYWDILRQGRA